MLYNEKGGSERATFGTQRFAHTFCTLYSVFVWSLWGASSILVPFVLSNRRARCYRQHLLAVTRDDNACVLGYGYTKQGRDLAIRRQK